MFDNNSPEITIISPGIKLKKKYIHNLNKNPEYEFRVFVDRLNLIEFIADFGGSENILL
jgi:hypothetical protein